MPANTSQAHVQCTLQTCPLSDGVIRYQPNLLANAFYLACFAVMLAAQLFLGIWYRTWSFLLGLSCGLALEIVGYVARIHLHSNPFYFNYFIEYIVSLTIAPTFMNCSIYVCFHRAIIAYDERLSRIKPKIFSIIFVTLDVICLIMQAAGGAIASTAEPEHVHGKSMQQLGIDVMIGGLALQVVSLFLFMICAADYIWRCLVKRKISGGLHAPDRNFASWKGFVVCLSMATVLIFVRSVYRTAELRGGFQGKLASNQVTFMIFEGAMILLACLCLTVVHPGPYLGSSWKS